MNPRRLSLAPGRRLLVLLVAVLLAGPFTAACTQRYRVGDRVVVEAGGEEYAAFVTEITGRARYRVHYQGYDERWDEEVTADRIRTTLAPDDPAPEPTRAPHAPQTSGERAKTNTLRTPRPYKAGDKLRVTWRGSKYSATVLQVISADELLVRYDGHEAAWDEIVTTDRIVSRK